MSANPLQTTETASIPTNTSEGFRGRACSFYTTRCGLAALGFSGASIMALTLDMFVARSMEGLRLPGDIAKFVNYSEVFGHGLGIAMIILVATTLDWRGWRVGGFLAAHAFGAGVLANSMKLLVARTRPYACPDLTADVRSTFVGAFPGLAWLTGSKLNLTDASYASFPSAHSATAAGLALALTICYPKGRWWFLLFACLAGSQRIFARAHFASDVLAGYAVAMVVALFVERVLGRNYVACD